MIQIPRRFHLFFSRSMDHGSRLKFFDAPKSIHRQAAALKPSSTVPGDWRSCMRDATFRALFLGTTCQRWLKHWLPLFTGVNGVKSMIGYVGIWTFEAKCVFWTLLAAVVCWYLCVWGRELGARKMTTAVGRFFANFVESETLKTKQKLV